MLALEAARIVTIRTSNSKLSRDMCIRRGSCKARSLSSLHPAHSSSGSGSGFALTLPSFFFTLASIFAVNVRRGASSLSSPGLTTVAARVLNAVSDFFVVVFVTAVFYQFYAPITNTAPNVFFEGFFFLALRTHTLKLRLRFRLYGCSC